MGVESFADTSAVEHAYAVQTKQGLEFLLAGALTAVLERLEPAKSEPDQPISTTVASTESSSGFSTKRAYPFPPKLRRSTVPNDCDLISTMAAASFCRKPKNRGGCAATALFDHRDFPWCPGHKDTPRQFECTRLITLDQVKAAIQKIPQFAERGKRSAKSQICEKPGKPSARKMS
jgi:hypothetical protein